jgi:hypothetical protein
MRKERDDLFRGEAEAVLGERVLAADVFGGGKLPGAGRSVLLAVTSERLVALRLDYSTRAGWRVARPVASWDRASSPARPGRYAGRLVLPDNGGEVECRWPTAESAEVIRLVTSQVV